MFASCRSIFPYLEHSEGINMSLARRNEIPSEQPKEECVTVVSEERTTYTFVNEPIYVNVAKNDDCNVDNIVNKYEENEGGNSNSVWNTIDKRIDVAATVALIPCGIGITFGWLFAGILVNCAIWAINIFIFTEPLYDYEVWFIGVPTVFVDFLILSSGFIIFRKWFFLILAISFGLAMWCINL